METLVKVRDLHKVYYRGSEHIDVLQGITLDIPSGDFLAPDVQDVHLTHRRRFKCGTLEASVGYSNTDADQGVQVSVDEGWRGFVSWRHELR